MRDRFIACMWPHDVSGFYFWYIIFSLCIYPHVSLFYVLAYPALGSCGMAIRSTARGPLGAVLPLDEGGSMFTPCRRLKGGGRGGGGKKIRELDSCLYVVYYET